ncbi:integrase [Halomicroarcula sp. F28]|uniref:site-specific integrase n=1 Tax=Haloarcula salinisoli TaxID=2487746 RepID=UPI001C72D468|nr:integrase [Halomicroarcula salinisoli]MBX0287905.1 integrase [Halomicroarcula salinisoli]
MSKYGDLDFDERWYDEPLEKYLDHKQSVDEVTDTTFNEIHLAIVATPTDVEWQAWDEFVSWRDGMTLADARAFHQQLDDAGLGSRTIEGYLRIVQSFLKELLERDVIESNPVAYICDEADFDHDEPDKIDRTVGEIGEYLRSVPNLQQRALGLTFAKTGIRFGENYNIDLPYLNLDHDIYDQILDQHDVTLVDEIANHPDTLYIPSEPTTGETFQGEQRVAGNKRKRSTKIPIDGELKKALLDWLVVRPETSHPHPLWVSAVGKPNRIGTSHPKKKLTNYWAEETGLVDDGSTGAFTPHWFRHFFTTNMKPGRGHHDDSIAPSLVKYIRGDVEDDIMEVYTHEWGDQVREQYLDAIYHFGIYD